jgi:hypothetical protein
MNEPGFKPFNLHEVSGIKVGARGVMGRLKSITPCALTFPSLETSCKPLRRREDADGVPGVSEF